MDSEKRAFQARKVTWIGLAADVALTLFKLLAGIFGKSSAIIAEAAHSLADFIVDIAVLLGFRFIHKPADKSHDYGHAKVEHAVELMVGVVLILVGGKILWDGSHLVIKALAGQILEKPGWVAFAAAAVSILLKEWLYLYTKRVGKRIKSQAVIANALHHRADSWSSMGALAGIGGAIILGEKWRVLDPIAAMVVSFFIIKVAIDLIRNGMRDLLEASLDDKTEEKITGVIESVRGVEDTHDLKTRRLGNNIAIDVHVEVKGTLQVIKAHEIASEVEEKLKESFGKDTFVSIHLEPSGDYKKEILERL